MISKYYYIIPMLLLFVVFGCRTQEIPEIQEDTGSTSVTLWTENTELFMEYPTLVNGQDATFAIHLSDMKDFKPVIRGKLTCVFESSDGGQITIVSESPSYPGIFRPTFNFSRPGIYDMELRLEGSQVTDIIRVSPIHVYANEADIPQAEESVPDEELITFLKEQQWKIEFRTELVRNHTLLASVRAVGEIISPPLYHSEVATPVSGMIHADRNVRIPAPGTWVRKGMVLTVISPLPDTKSDIMRIHTEYLLAKAEFERAQRLYAEQAISEKRLEVAQLRFKAKKVSNDVIAWHVDYSLGNEGEKAVIFYQVKAPIDGFIEEINVKLGQTIQAGEKLVTITNPDRVLLKVRVPLIRISEIKNTSNASFTIEGYNEEFEVARLNGRLISFGSKVDEESRTVPVIYELDNPENQLKIGMFADVSIKTGDVIERLAVPTSAVYNENDTNVVYVHVEGESFAKRMIKTGITDRGYMEIIEGIAEGDRVVTVGGYQVRLSSLSTVVPTGHGHAH